MKALLRVLLAACAAVGALAQNAPSIRISADHDEIYLGESVILRVEVRDCQTRHPQPDLDIPPETATVHALGQQTSSSSYISLVNGRRECVESHATIHTYRLVPRKAGRLNIPPIVIGSKDSTIKSQPFAILVRKPDEQDEVKIRLYAIPPDPFPDEPFTVRLEIDVVPRPGQPELDPLSSENLPGDQLPLLIVPYLEDDFRPDSL
ncbi:MAG: BatD family protein, partial [Kiritimatiellia bacterium]